MEHQGAQEFPLGAVVIDKQKLGDALTELSGLDVGGTPGDEIIGFRTR